jgi:hypothetical protein
MSTRFFGLVCDCQNSSQSGSAALGKGISYNSPSGVVPVASPPGFGATTGRVNVTLSNNTSWDALTNGSSDGQLVAVSIVAGSFSLTLVGGSGFRVPFGSTTITLDATILMYWDASADLWVVT